MKCEDFRSAVAAGEDSAETLVHLRTCEDCLNFAISQDPDFMFRAIGGEIEPPGGAEAFAADVMHQIHVRGTERTVSRRESRLSALHRWGLAAAATIAVVSGAMLWPRGETNNVPPVTVAQAVSKTPDAPLAIRPVVESWNSSSAMIIEIPEEDTSDLKVVMIFDESLPVDL